MNGKRSIRKEGNVYQGYVGLVPMISFTDKECALMWLDNYCGPVYNINGREVTKETSNLRSCA